LKSNYCNLCEYEGFPPSDCITQVRGSTRQFQDQVFTVWRCPRCSTIHCITPPSAEMYANYPIHRQRYDAIMRRTYAVRLRYLKKNGLKCHHQILDYGCGSGHFVRFLREQGYSISGYDPYSKEFTEKETLQRTYDFVLAQDVIEHAQDPRALFGELVRLCAISGTICLCTPDSERIRFSDTRRLQFNLHLPYHAHTLSRTALLKLAKGFGVELLSTQPEYYFNTWIPVANFRFLEEYVTAKGGVLDVIFDPLDLPFVLRSPRLIFSAFFGRACPITPNFTAYFVRASSQG